ncbi:methyltransferase [Herbidospora sp. RD11066]
MTQNDPAAPVWDAIYGISRFAALATMAELGCADHLADGPLTADVLADRCGADPLSLHRTLREVASMGFLRTVPEGYELTESGHLLREGVPGSVRSAVRMVGQEAFWYAMGQLPETVRTGKSAFKEKFGHVYEYVGRNPEIAVLFDHYMTVRAEPFAAGLANNYDLSGARKVIDLGGGRGHILGALLTANPHLEGVLFDLERVLSSGEAALTEAGLAGRCEFVVGDFFAHIPSGPDVYLLANVIHNWSDEDCVRILRNVRAAMPADGKVLILEIVLSDDDSPHVGKDGDIRMLSLSGGGMERTPAEYQTLLEKSGLTTARILPLSGWASVIEAVPN